jgi:membrane protein
MFTHIRAFWNYLQRISDAYNRHFGMLMAAAVSFYALLSAVPLLTVGVAVLGWIVGGSQQALLQAKAVIQEYLPASGDVVYETLSEIKRDSGWLGIAGLVGLLVSGSAIFTNLEIAFNNIWGVRVMRNWWKQRLVALGTTVLIICLMFSSIALTSLMTYIQNVNLPGLGMRAGEVPYVWSVAGNLASLALSILMFTVIYKIIPNKPILWREAFLGGAFAGIAWELAKYVFALYLSRFSNYNKVYGSLGSLVIIVVWTFYSMTILFIGAEIAADHGTKLPAADEKPENVPCPQPVEGSEEAEKAQQGEGVDEGEKGESAGL